MSWHRIFLTTGQIEGEGLLRKIEKQFERYFLEAEGPSDMAMFSDNTYQGDRIGIYFTPGCSPACDGLISRYGGDACETPDKGRVFLLDGNDDALDLL